MKTSDIKMGPIRHKKLPGGFVSRVKRYKEILKEVEKISLEETLDAFKRDLNPVQELLIWESIAKSYNEAIRLNPEITLKQKKEVYKKVLMSTLG